MRIILSLLVFFVLTPLVFAGDLETRLIRIEGSLNFLEKRVTQLESIKSSWSCSACCGCIYESNYARGEGSTAADALRNTQENCDNLYFSSCRDGKFFFSRIERTDGRSIYTPATISNSCVKN